MEEKARDSVSSDESICTTNSDSSEVSLQSGETTSTVDDRRYSGLCKSIRRIKSSFFRSGCPKTCMDYKETSLERSQMSNCKPQTPLESPFLQKKSVTKPSDGLPLSYQLKMKMKGASKKLQSTLPFLEKTTRRTVRKMKYLYENFTPRRVLGFKCDLKKCDSTLMQCSMRACKKKGMLFDERTYPRDPEKANSSASNSSTVASSASKRDQEF